MNKPKLRTEMPKISLEIFREMISTLPAEKLAKIPPEKLPEDIPMSVVNEAPLYVRPVVENLLLERNSLALRTRQAIKSALGQAGLEALDTAKQSEEKANLRTFATKLLELKQLRQRCVRMEPQESDNLLTRFLQNIEKLLPDLLSEKYQVDKGITALDVEVELSGVLLKMIHRARRRLKEQEEIIGRFLSDYFSEKMTICHQIMQHRLTSIEEQEAQQQRLAEEIETLRSELVHLQRKLRLPFGKRKNLEDSESLRQQITQISTEMKTSQIPVDETELTLWLDAVVETNLNPAALERATMATHIAKQNLLQLLQRYCYQQESSARNVARNPFVQIDPKRVIEYTLKSEQFILNYFQHKRIEATNQLSLAADMKISELDKIEKELLQELKQSSYLAK